MWYCVPYDYVVTGWSQWSGWGACPLSCGGGTQIRQRTCPDECTGHNNEKQQCNSHPCPPG